MKWQQLFSACAFGHSHTLTTRDPQTQQLTETCARCLQPLRPVLASDVVRHANEAPAPVLGKPVGKITITKVLPTNVESFPRKAQR